VAGLALAAVVVAACGTPQTVSPTAPIATPTSAPSPTLTCDTFQTLRQVDTLLAGRDFEAHYLTIGDKLTLSIWMVDPDIDPAASAATLAANNQLAFDFGLALSWRAISEVPCVRQMFLDINPMIVDRLYRNWYLDVIPMSAFDGLDHPTPAQLVDAVDRGGAGFAFHRRAAPVADSGPAPSGSCGWPDARTAIHAQLGAERRNRAAYLIVGYQPSVQAPWAQHARENVVVEAQVDFPDAAAATDSAILEQLNKLAPTLACLQPAVDVFEVFVVDQAGRLVVYVQIPSLIISARAFPLPRDAVMMRRMAPVESPAESPAGSAPAASPSAL
jgi:hypothetical protein